MVPVEPAALTAAGRSPGSALERPVETRLGFLPADVLSIGYLSITSVLVVLGHGRLPNWGFWLALHLAFLAVVIGLRWVPRRGLPALQLVRETYALWLLPFAYGSLERLNRIVTDGFYDDVVLRWDFRLFGSHPHTWLMGAAAVPLLSEFLHLSYILYQILVPILGFTLFFQKRYEALRVMATTMVLTMYSCYLIFIFFPVLGPYYTFARPEGSGQGFFPALVEAMLNAGASRGTAFPSSHVAGSVAVAILAHRFSRRLSYGLVVLALSITLATVYGSFHYAIDACVGFFFGVATAMIGPRLHAWLLRRTRLHMIRFRFPHLRFRWRGGFRGEIVRGRNQRSAAPGTKSGDEGEGAGGAAP